MRNLHITVSNKVATYLNRDGSIVCGNSDYQITFAFDDEWSDYTSKTARFIWNDKYTDVTFSGSSVTVPKIIKTHLLKVGVYAGELSTTTAAEIPCIFSVLCENATAGSEDEPNTGDGGINLSNYVTKQELEEGYYTKDEVDEAIENIDFSNYYTKTQVDAAIANAITTTLNTAV